MHEPWLVHVVVHFCVFIAVVGAAERSGPLDDNCFIAALLLIVQEEMCGPLQKKVFQSLLKCLRALHAKMYIKQTYLMKPAEFLKHSN